MFHHVDWLRGQTVFVRSSSSLLMFPVEWVQCLQQNSPGNSDLSHTHFCYPWKRNWRSWKISRVAKLFYTYMQVYWFLFITNFYSLEEDIKRRYQKFNNIFSFYSYYLNPVEERWCPSFEKTYISFKKWYFERLVLNSPGGSEDEEY